MWRQAWREMGKAQGYYSCDDEFKICIEEEEEFMKRKSSSFRTVSGFDNLVSIRHVTNRE